MIFESLDVEAGDLQNEVCENASQDPACCIAHQGGVARQKAFFGTGGPQKHPDNKIPKIEQDARELEGKGAEPDPGGPAEDQDERYEKDQGQTVGPEEKTQGSG